MIAVRLYKPNEVDVLFDFPEAWNDCSITQLETIADCILLQKISRQQLLMQLFRQCLKLQYPKYKIGKIEYILALIDIEDLAMHYMQLTNFIFDSIELTKQPYPMLNELGAPKSAFEDITCAEYEDTEALFFKLTQQLKAYSIGRRCPHFASENAKLLEQFLAVLWRPFVNNSRVPYVNYTSNYATVIGTESQRLVCMLWYMGCKAQLPKMFPMVFTQDPAASDAEPDAMATTKLIHHGAGPKNGTRADIRNMLLFEFLFDLQLEAEKTAIG
jgi:hypothetical protein